MFVLTAGAERVGKSVGTAAEAFAWIPVSQLIWIAGPQYRDTVKEFAYLAEACLNFGITEKALIKMSDDGPSRMTIIDPAQIDPKTKKPKIVCMVETRSLWDIERALVAEAPDIILVVEAGLVPRDPTEKLRLRVSTRRGRVWMSGTLETASPWFAAAYTRWKTQPNEESGMSVSVPLYENEQDFPGGRDNPEIATMRRVLKPSTYSHRVEGKPAPSDLLVFKDTFERGDRPKVAMKLPFIHVKDGGDIRDRFPVQIAVDPGHRPSYYTVSFVQVQEKRVCVIGEVAMLGSHHEEVIREATRHPCWGNVVGGVIDPWAAKQHGLGNRQTPWDIWLAETGMELRLPEPAPNPVQIIDRYQYFIRHASGEMRFAYDPDRCPRLDYEWRHWNFARGADGLPIRADPLKTNCDAIKGVGYLLVDMFGEQLAARRGFDRPRPARVTKWRFR